MTTTKGAAVLRIPNPYALDEIDGVALYEEVQSALHFGGTLASSPTGVGSQVWAMGDWVRIVGRGDRKCTNSLVWELCNAVYLRAAEGKTFPALPDHDNETCPPDHQVKRHRYNDFLVAAVTGAHQEVVDAVDSIVGEDVYEDLCGWMCALTDHLALMRFGS